MARIEETLAPYRRAECLLVAAGFALSAIRAASHGELESWIKATREAAQALPGRLPVPAPATGPVKRVSKRYLERKGK